MLIEAVVPCNTIQLQLRKQKSHGFAMAKV